MSLHRQRTHPEPVPGCYGCHISSLRFNVSGAWNDIEARERVLDRDLSAFESLVKQGYAPTSPIGAARLSENATHRLHIEDPNNPVLAGLSDRQLDEFTLASQTIGDQAAKDTGQVA